MADIMDDVRPELGERFAWCFSHGRMHRFGPEPWCTGTWVAVAGVTWFEACQDKESRFGDAAFTHHLTFEQRAAIDEGRA